MILHSIEAGPVDTRGYLIADEQSREAVIVDVPMESHARFVSLLQQERLHPIAIVLTHGHFDHVGDVAPLARSLGTPVYIHPADAPMLEQPMSNFPGLDLPIEGMKATHLLEGGDVLECGGLRLRIIHAPGHTPGHILLYEMRENILLSGDVLFHSSIGRTDLPGGDYDALMENITKKVLTLSDDTIVYPGHGEATTIGFERNHNPFILEYLEHL
ncbi:MAG: MBL fold metallo-hydrolase [Bacteroidetes bacterium]|nr:MBL fold metallo-hydrolase [Bacteroidota bacterium]